MERGRFKRFILLVEGIHKSIGGMKYDIAPALGVKSVHIFWLYDLLVHSEGLTPTEIAEVSMIDRSLVSREIAYLKKRGYVKPVSESEGKRSYNSRIVLTDEGRELAKRISLAANKIQQLANTGISDGELAAFYSTLEKIHTNLERVSDVCRDSLKSGSTPDIDTV